jgi:formiminotetrahydrofolate cyclodeaminase
LGPDPQPTIGRVSDDARDVWFRDLTLGGFTEVLASDEPVPGGGSASAVAAALGASLVAMVAALSSGRPKYAPHTALHEAVQPRAEAQRDRLLLLADEDAAAYGAYAAALRLPRDTDEQVAARRDAIRAAARAAAAVPLQIVGACYSVLVLADALAGRSNANAASDLNVSSLLAEAAARGAAENVFVNLPSIGDPPHEGELMTATTDLIDEIERVAAGIREVVLSSESRDPLAPVDIAALPRG